MDNKRVKITNGLFKNCTGIIVSQDSPRKIFTDVTIHLDDEATRKFGIRAVGIDKKDIIHISS